MPKPYLLLLIVVGGCIDVEPQLVGTWEHRDTSDRLVFYDDGQYEWATGSGSEKGTYEIADSLVTFERRDSRISFSYYAGPSELALWVLLPQGPTQNIVGTWSRTMSREGMTGNTTAVFGPDGTVEWWQVSAFGGDVSHTTGVYRLDNDQVTVELEGHSPLVLGWVDGEALALEATRYNRAE